MARRYRRRPGYTAGVLLALALLAALRWFFGEPAPVPPANLPEGLYRLERVVDGDTLLVDGPGRVRLMGIDCPESVKPEHPVEPWGPEASEFTRQFLRGGQVRLQFDRERIDQYGRLLAYAFVGEKLLNEELLRAGLARAELQYHYSSAMKRRFREAQDAARAARRGIWSGASPADAPR
jgi:micrococcal nuclease